MIEIVAVTVVVALVITEAVLIYELRQVRRELVKTRGEIPKWVGVSIAFTALSTAIKLRESKNGDGI